MTRTPLRRSGLKRGKGLNRYMYLPRVVKMRRAKGEPTHTTRDGRLILSPADEAKQLDRIYERDNGICHLCGEYVPRTEASRDHLITRGMGESKRDDSDENIKLAHKLCNTRRGSKAIKYCVCTHSETAHATVNKGHCRILDCKCQKFRLEDR